MFLIPEDRWPGPLAARRHHHGAALSAGARPCGSPLLISTSIRNRAVLRDARHSQPYGPSRLLPEEPVQPAKRPTGRVTPRAPGDVPAAADGPWQGGSGPGSGGSGRPRGWLGQPPGQRSALHDLRLPDGRLPELRCLTRTTPGFRHPGYGSGGGGFQFQGMLCIGRLHRWGGLAATAEVPGVPPGVLPQVAARGHAADIAGSEPAGVRRPSWARRVLSDCRRGSPTRW
jgi:hypothetical protein